MNHLLPTVMLIAVIAVWGWTFVVVKDAITAYGVVAFLAVRFAVGAAVMSPVAFRRVGLRSIRTGSLIGAVLAAAYLFQTFGLYFTTPTNCALITGLCMVLAPLINWALFGVRTGWPYWIAIGVSLAGLVLLGRDGWNRGDLLTLGAAACFGLHIALLDRYAKEHDAGALALVQVGVAAVIFFGVWPAVDVVAWPTTDVWIALAITGVLATAGAFYVQTFVQQRLSAARTALIIATEPAFGAFFGFLLAGDWLGPIQIVGAVLMIGAVLAASTRGEPSRGDD